MGRDEISVKSVWYPDRGAFVLRYRDPLSGKVKTKSAKTKNRREAERAAAKWESDLRDGRYKPMSKVSWTEFRQRYETEVLASLAAGTEEKVSHILDCVERRLGVVLLRELTAERIAFYQTELRKAGRSESTIASHLAHLRAALAWAVRAKLVPALPTIEKPRRAKNSKLMKGRPVTLEEFERMLAVVPKVVGAEHAPAWERYLRGLWASGLRLVESLELYWDRPDKLRVDFDGKRPMLHIPAELEKGHKDRLLPMSPEFAEFLAATPEHERTGQVFPIPYRRGVGAITPRWAGRIVTQIGKAAGVKVDERPCKPDGKGRPTVKVKWASAHDLRRAFGLRWSTRVMPAVLQLLMRHEAIETSLRYYVGRDAESTADVLWAAHEAASGNRIGNRGQKTDFAQEPARIPECVNNVFLGNGLQTGRGGT